MAALSSARGGVGSSGSFAHSPMGQKRQSWHAEAGHLCGATASPDAGKHESFFSRKLSMRMFHQLVPKQLLREESDNEGVDVENCTFARQRLSAIDQICKATNFTRREVKVIYRGFKQVCPTGLVNREQFKEIYAHLFPQGDVTQYALLVFNTFDHDSNGQISFEEFVRTLSVLSRGHNDEKLRWIFQLYDVERTGYMSRVGVSKLVRSVYDMLGRWTQPPISVNDIVAHIDFVCQKFQLDGVNSAGITLETFMQICKKDPDVIEALSLFDTVLY